MIHQPERDGDDSVAAASAFAANQEMVNALGDTTINHVQKRIIHTLSIYPRLNMSMLQIGIGTGFPPAIWHPALEALIGEGKVVRSTFTTTNPVSKREQTYTVITLADDYSTEDVASRSVVAKL